MPNNRGSTHSYLFFLKFGYWFGKRAKNVEPIPTKGNRRRMSSVDQNDGNGRTAFDERNQILDDETKNIE